MFKRQFRLPTTYIQTGKNILPTASRISTRKFMRLRTMSQTCAKYFSLPTDLQTSQNTFLSSVVAKFLLGGISARSFVKLRLVP